MKGIKAFFTDPVYRWIIFETLKLKFLRLPLVSSLMAWYYAGKIFKSNDNGWDRYTEFKELEGDFDKVMFVNCLLRLEMCISLDEELKEEHFYLVKEQLLDTSMINRKDLKDFKEWVSGIEINETDATKVREVLDQVTSED